MRKAKKGLCFWGDEKFSSCHNCGMKQLYRLEMFIKEDSDGEDNVLKEDFAEEV